MESGPLAGANPAHPFMVSRPSLSRSPGQPPRPLTLRISFPSPRSGVRRAAPSTPRSGALAATLFGGLRAGGPPPSRPLYEDPPRARPPLPRAPRARGPPAAPGNVARDLQVLLPRRDPRRTQDSFRPPQDLLPSPARGGRGARAGRPPG